MSAWKIFALEIETEGKIVIEISLQKDFSRNLNGKF
jgi:hypothetical protein